MSLTVSRNRILIVSKRLNKGQRNKVTEHKQHTTKNYKSIT